MLKKTKLLIDTDIGSDIDDALCLAYLLQNPGCAIAGITTCSTEPEKRAEIADSICRHAGYEIPIYPGLREPLEGRHLQSAVHQYGVVSSLPHKNTFPEGEAVEFMRRTIEENPHEIVLLPIGPLTNIGALFSRYPHVVPLVREVSVFGGSYFEEGKAFTATEWNIRNDPTAAKIVFDSGVSLRVTGLDVSLRLKISCRKFLEMPRRERIFDVVKLYAAKFIERTDDMYFHDALAAAVVFCEDICKYKTGFISVDLTDERGRTDLTEAPDGNALVAYDVDTEKFFRHYLHITEKI